MVNTGRGARERILRAAAHLFYVRGINATGVEELRREADVSVRTLYNHFAGKDDVVVAYLEQMADAAGSSLGRADLPPRERLLGIFTPPAPKAGDPVRGCPLINAGVELADPDHPAHRYAAERKARFAERLTEIAREAGAADPESLGQRLALLYDGASARSTVLNSDHPHEVALALATELVDAALPVRPGPAPDRP
ncbi:TetR family transcriptional regulator [Amycolatopsis mediterranei S699]|uniref:TetR family transcriptional regulator n=3 Tax=Amycolatopsis mediterranei TaxID=33910 RepID=A0A0H3DAV6_AMYMU|nr:TetR/AcrR family transcriptional regulator [Amycolatopsis mediterranei]ADJ47402.1 TetR family transcriptional regulator [Amycolatopsis mediterranei U32]AEK44248.1 TetR family transcriptional regulator [Amycolatopsis mediterranei S699]AFO79113.1 TetR family transcriptional regulator [Amycolatopsis mediterranei S699]AGT86241.1 TetR family transcriptional regulator [Amycolatopsis mediterranei RB]KDO12410.1 TetR family transcriptional regulator [Amycolatopsis mediterranei]